MYKTNLLKLQNYNIYTVDQPLELETQWMSVSCGYFSLCGAIGRLLIDKVAWCSCMRNKTIVNRKYFIINSKITALCSRSRSAVLTYIYRHMHTSGCLLENEDDRHIRTYTHTHAWFRVHDARTSQGAPLFSTSRSASISYTLVVVCWRFGWLWYIHAHIYASLLAQTHVYLVVHSSFTLAGAIPLRTWSITCNLRTYFTCLGRVFLVETVVLQTVLLDIWAWSARFLVMICCWIKLLIAWFLAAM